MSVGTAAFARRWPEARAAVAIARAEDWRLAGPGSIADVSAALSWEDTMAGLAGAVERGAWIALSPGHLAALAERWGADTPEGRRLLLKPARIRTPEAVYRVRDVVLAASALLVLAPVLLILALLVVADSGLPVFFRAAVVGRGGRTFEWRKFRSMRAVRGPDDRAEAFRRFAEGKTSGPDTKVVDEQRITRIGHFLRRHALDELPQLWNVLAGDMAIVGPRPCLPYEFEIMLPWQRERAEVRPGLTGLWQVHGRSRVGFDDGMAMDRLAALTRSWWGDWGLMIGTVGVVMKGTGGR